MITDDPHFLRLFNVAGGKEPWAPRDTMELSKVMQTLQIDSGDVFRASLATVQEGTNCDKERFPYKTLYLCKNHRIGILHKNFINSDFDSSFDLLTTLVASFWLVFDFIL